MRPIPAPRLGDAHGLLRAIGERDRIRLDEFVTEFSVEELFPPGLENALGRTRQFISFARSAGLLNEDRGTVELTDMGKRYVRAGDSERPFDVAPAQAEWLRRLLRERHMTDSIYHGAAIGLSLCASNPPGFHASSVDFGRALNELGRAGWDSENTFQSQGERYTTFLRDLELIDEERRLTPTGQQARDELTLPIHMSLKDLAGQLNPGGAEAAAHEGEAEFAAAQAPPPEPEPVAEAEPEPVAAPAGEDEYEDVGPGAGPSPAAAPAPVAAGPPTPPEDIWESGPGDRTQAYRAVGVEPPAVETPVPAEAAPAAPTADAPMEGTPAAGDAAAGAPSAGASVPGAGAPAASAVDAPVEAAPSGAAAPSHTASTGDSPVDGTSSSAAPAGGAPAGAPLAPPSSAAPAGGAPAGAPLEPSSSAAAPGGAPASAPLAPPSSAAAPGGAPASAPLAPPSSAAPPGGAPAGAPLEPPSYAAPPAAPFEPVPAAVPSLEELAGAATVASSAAQAAPAVSANAIATAAQDAGLRLPAGVYAAVAAALAGGHVVLVGPAGCGKTTLALAVVKAAAQAGQSGGATLVTAAQRWSNRDTVGRPGDEEWERGVVVDAAARGRWLVIDELGRARLDRALGELSSFLGGSPVALPDGESEPSPSWRVVATSTSALEGSPALVRRFAHVYVPPPHDTDLALAIGAAAGSETTAAAAIRRLIPAREIGPIGTGAFLDAARFAAHRNAASQADEATLAREALAAHIAPVLGRLEQDARARLWALAG